MVRFSASLKIVFAYLKWTLGVPNLFFRFLDDGLCPILIIYLTDAAASSVLWSAFGLGCRLVEISILQAV
jgi:hypothetical protein